MATLSVTPASVVAGADSDQMQGIAGATITAGMTIYQDAVDSKLKPADADGSIKSADVKGVALHGATDGQPLRIHRSGRITIGATTTVGAQYSLSATPGGIADSADVLTGLFATRLGVGGAANTILVDIFASGQRVP